MFVLSVFYDLGIEIKTTNEKLDGYKRNNESISYINKDIKYQNNKKESRNLKTIILSSSLYSFAIHEIILDFPIPGTPLISIVEVLSLSTNFFIISS